MEAPRAFPRKCESATQTDKQPARKPKNGLLMRQGIWPESIVHSGLSATDEFYQETSLE
jgi:hypothetical protein